MSYYVYILANKLNTVIYTGITNDLIRRIDEHKRHINPDSFTAKYDVTKLVYYEDTIYVNAAIEREKQIKGWNRKRKNKLVESKNPQWKELFFDIVEG
ncbi:MAG: GIY-YIG nuclease family protein [Oscillospiraceae bacterium]|nr:GIY-YIG nuclease family protein [Oscillospiraceae bacterium]